MARSRRPEATKRKREDPWGLLFGLDCLGLGDSELYLTFYSHEGGKRLRIPRGRGANGQKRKKP